MQEKELLELVDKIQHYKCEFQNIEVKAAAGGCPERLYPTLSSFSNQSGGGIIVFGLEEKAKFKVVGVYDNQDLQHQVAEQCKQMEPEVRPLFTVAEIEGKFIVSAEIPEVDVTERPVFYRGVGKQRGSYVRVGKADELMNGYEIYTHEAFRRRIHDDIREVEGAKRSFLQEDLLQNYLNELRKTSKNLADIDDEEILELMGITKGGCPTLAGLLVFGKYPQAYFPNLSITAVVIPGFQMGDTDSDGARFLANECFNGTIGEMLEGAVAFVERNCRVKTIINDRGRRQDKPEFPTKAFREAIINALLHRDYSFHTEGTPIGICMFSDRMEIVNRGGLYGRISVDQLGNARPEPRNPTLAKILGVLHIAENRYSGIPTIRQEMESHGLAAPKFSVRYGDFKVTLYNDMYRSSGSMGKKEALLEFCRTPKSAAEITAFLGRSQSHVVKTVIQPLLKSGHLQMTLPDKPTSRRQKYFTVADQA